MVENWRARLGNSIERARRKANMTQDDLHEAVGLSRNTIGLYERGERAPDFDVLRRIAAAVSVDQFEVDDNIRISFTQNGHKQLTEPEPKQFVLNFDGTNGDGTNGVSVRIEPVAGGLMIKALSA
ncbi:MAG: helix-turn-helix transcriptional regulator [Candidatus Korobacteraceae bacterium]